MRKNNESTLTEEQQKEKEINELIMTEDNIEMTAHMANCPECRQGGLKGAMELVSVLGCNIYDEHQDETNDFEEDEKVSHGFRQKM